MNELEVAMALNINQRQQIGALIEAERAMACHWWTMLSEMRCRGQLPEWARKQMAGSEGEYDLWTEARQETNKALFGTVRHTCRAEKPEWVNLLLDDAELEVTTRQAPCEGADGAVADKQLQEEVLQHLSRDIALVGTNERKLS